MAHPHIFRNGGVDRRIRPKRIATVQEQTGRILAEPFPGGRLVYSTCTITRGENEAVVRAFLAKEPHFVLEKPEMSLPGAQDTGFGTLFLPHRTGTDGFFVAVLAKNKG